MRTQSDALSIKKMPSRKTHDKRPWQFMDDQPLMKALAKQLTSNKVLSDSSVVRVWIAGCFPCENIYAAGIFLCEELEKFNLKTAVRIFATDPSEDNINHARKGFITGHAIDSAPANYQKDFFVKNAQRVQLIRSMRDKFIFAIHDFLTDTSFGKMDLIMCKDQIDHLKPAEKQRALSTFYSALNPGGILVIGQREPIITEPEFFKLVSKRFNFYEKLEKPTSARFIKKNGAKKTAESPERFFGSARSQIQPLLTDSLLLNELAPARVLIDSNFTIIEFHGDIHEYLEVLPGKATLSLFKLIRNELFAELNKALYELRSSTETKAKVELVLNSGELLSINVIAMKPEGSLFYVLIFQKITTPATARKLPAKEISKVQQLEEQLDTIRRMMDNITQEYENAGTQLQAANEELMSNSEELQSLNEELETSKEELLQTNEELVTANQQLYNHNEHLIAARKKIEENSAMIRKLYMESPALIATLTGPDHVYDLINPNYQALFGSYLLEGLPLRDALPKLQGEEDIVSIVNEVYHTGKKIIANELPLALPGKQEGNILFFNFTFQPIYSATRTITGVLCFGYEVTELVAARKFKEAVIERQQLFSDELEWQVKERTASLRASNIELEHSNKNLEQFASIASHDLQEPLRKIKTFTTILKTKFGAGFDDEVLSWIKKIGLSAERMSVLISEVLNFSRITQSSSGFVKTDIGEIVDSILSDFDLLIGEKKARMIIGKLPVIDAVPLQMNQLFYNLIGNALKFSDSSRTPKISIFSNDLTDGEGRKYKDLDPTFRYCKITVADNGIGFDPEFSEQIFEIFQRLNNSALYEGTGIGLALCRKIVFNHRGRISATSNNKKGAIFDIILPLKQLHL